MPSTQIKQNSAMHGGDWTTSALSLFTLSYIYLLIVGFTTGANYFFGFLVDSFGTASDNWMRHQTWSQSLSRGLQFALAIAVLHLTYRIIKFRRKFRR